MSPKSRSSSIALNVSSPSIVRHPDHEDPTRELPTLDGFDGEGDQGERSSRVDGLRSRCQGGKIRIEEDFEPAIFRRSCCIPILSYLAMPCAWFIIPRSRDNHDAGELNVE